MQTRTTYDGLLAAGSFSGNGAAITSIDGSHVSLTGAAGHVATWDLSTEVLTHQAQATPTQGGTGLNTSASTGFPYVTAGTWSVSNSPSVIVNANMVTGTVYGYVQTTDNTPTTACSVNTVTTGTGNIKTSINMTIRATAGKFGDNASTINTENWYDKYEITRLNGSPPTVVVTQVNEDKSGTLPAYALSVVNNVGTLDIRVTGAAATIVNWAVVAEYIKVSFEDSA